MYVYERLQQLKPCMARIPTKRALPCFHSDFAFTVWFFVWLRNFVLLRFANVWISTIGKIFCFFEKLCVFRPRKTIFKAKRITEVVFKGNCFVSKDVFKEGGDKLCSHPPSLITIASEIIARNNTTRRNKPHRNQSGKFTSRCGLFDQKYTPIWYLSELIICQRNVHDCLDWS